MTKGKKAGIVAGICGAGFVTLLGLALADFSTDGLYLAVAIAAIFGFGGTIYGAVRSYYDD